MLPISHVDVNGTLHYYKIFGIGKVNLVLEIGLASTIGEWWHIAESLSQKYTVLLYERSKRTMPKRTPENIANELFKLLETIPHEETFIIASHSQGGLYAQQFARMYPSSMKGIVFIDPLSTYDNEFKRQLTPKEMQKSGVDKSANLSICKRLARMHMGGLIKAIMKNAPPFYYYNDFSKDAANYILKAYTDPVFLAAAVEEYHLAHDTDVLDPLLNKTGFPEIPIALVTHAYEYSVSETIAFGKTTRELACKVEDIWQSVMEKYLELSKNNKHFKAQNCGHYIHLTEPWLIDNALQFIDHNARMDTNS